MNAMPSSRGWEESHLQPQANTLAFSVIPAAEERRPVAIEPSRRRSRSGSRAKSSKTAARLSTARTETVTARELQSAVLIVLALYASMALLNAGAEWRALAQHWHSFVQFLVTDLILR